MTKIENIQSELKRICSVNRNIISGGVAIIAGNPCFKIVDEKKNTYKIYKQIIAFEAGLIAYDIFMKQGIKATITILIDHKESKKIFLKSKSKNKNIYKFSHLNEKIIKLYLPILKKYDIALEDINILFEKDCLNRFLQWIENPENIKYLNKDEKFEFEVFRDDACKEKSINVTDENLLSKKGILLDPDCAVDLSYSNKEENRRLNCRCIFAYTIKKANEYAGLKNKKGLILGIWGDDEERCDKSVIMGGEDIVKKYIKEVKSNIVDIFNMELGEKDEDIIEL